MESRIFIYKPEIKESCDSNYKGGRYVIVDGVCQGGKKAEKQAALFVCVSEGSDIPRRGGEGEFCIREILGPYIITILREIYYAHKSQKKYMSEMC